jgi:DNA mismatch repair protein MutL
MNSVGGRILVLENHVIDQIAAGEVVDRPAHMIKELCENSLDAGATEITVEFKNGGRDVLIRDNGRGIEREDLPLALARHATSKIASSDDLWQINTYGFRGEALASIGAVSRVTITSRPREAPQAFEIECRFGEVSQVHEAGGDFGTTIQVNDLFQNVPARLKFLKTETGESSAIKTQLKALALANPYIQLRVLLDNELLYFWPATTTDVLDPSAEALKLRVQQVLDQAEMYSGEETLEQYRARVIVSSPNSTAGTARQIWIFVRGRYVQDRGVQAAVTEAYRHLLMHGEYPIAVVHLDCDPEDLDVNVSPTKSQVKFREPGQAFRVVQRAVRGVLEKAPWLESMLKVTSSPVSTYSQPEPSSSGSYRLEDFVRQPILSAKESTNLQSSPAPEIPESFRFSTPDLERTQFKAKVFESTSVASTASGARWSKLEVLGQAHLTYIVTQKEDAILFIDQHAAHERVMFERLQQSFQSGAGEVQSFLFPHVVKLSEEAVPEVMKISADLYKMGLSIDQLGPNEIAVQSAPAIVKPEALGPLFEKLGADLIDKSGSFAVEKKIGDWLSTMACHSAVRAGQALSLPEMKSLLEQMDEFPLSSFCPHGRPVFVEYPIRKLEKDFGRIV